MFRLTRNIHLVLISALALVMVRCTTYRINGKGVLLKKVIIKCEDPTVNKNDIYGYLKQKPNRKLIGLNIPHLLKRGPIGKKNLLTNGAGFPFYLHIHNLVNPKHLKKRLDKKHTKYLLKHARWEKFQVTRSGRKRREPKDRTTTIGTFLLKIGEEPVLIDSSKTSRSTKQLLMYLDNKGYFHSDVKDTIIYPWLQRNRKKKAIQCYIIKPSVPYTIHQITWDIKDPNMVYDITTDTVECKVVRGANYDVDVFEAERDRITRSLRNAGYFLFSKEYIRFTADTTIGDHKVDIHIIVRMQQVKSSDSTWQEVDHQRFYVRNIIVRSMSSLGQLKQDTMAYDTTFFKEITFLRNAGSRKGVPIESQLKFKPSTLAPRISFRPNILYRQVDYEATYRQLTGLRVFRQVVIDPHIVAKDKLDINVDLFPLARQNFIVQVEGTNSGGNLGIGGSFSYNNNNLFHGAEILEFKVKGGTEVQQSFGETQPTSPTSQLAFNTISAGSDASLNIPREFFPFNILVRKNRREEDRKAQERRTVFNASFNYQKRIDYDRALGNLSYGYTFRYKSYSKFGFFPIELNVVKVKPGEGLLLLLQNSDPLLQYRFTDHVINDARLSFVYNTQSSDPNQRFVKYLKLDIESSGLFLYGLYSATNQVPDAAGSYRIGGIPFSHYLRTSADLHWHWRIGEYETVVLRAAAGAGLPLANYPTLPLEKSFYAGGANGIRAWEARTLGPGSYEIPSDQKYAQFGDIQLEYNVELRFKITNSLNAAVFADGGNIWILKADSLRPGAEFQPKQFVNDLAFGPGAGLRYDLGFFIVRLDWAFKLRDPSYAYGERWWIPGERPIAGNLNFGIGYPF